MISFYPAFPGYESFLPQFVPAASPTLLLEAPLTVSEGQCQNFNNQEYDNGL
jgi:hypothetical protein